LYGKTIIMETILIQTESKSTKKLLIDLAKKMGEKVQILDKEIAEDLAFGKMMQKAKTGKTVSKKNILEALAK